MNKINFIPLIISLLILPEIIYASNTTPSPINLQELIEKAEPYSTLIIPRGVYYGPLIITKPLKIIGEGWPTIDGRKKGDVIIVEANDVTITGLRIINSDEWYGSDAAGIKIKANNTLIFNNIIENVLFGIYLQNSWNSIIRNNIISSFKEKSLNDRGYGVYLWYSFNNTVESNRISYSKDGIYNEHAYNNTLKNNYITNSRYGIHLMYSDDYIIKDNIVTRNLVGMALMYSINLHVINNTVANNKGLVVSEGIFIREAGNVTLRKNIIYGHFLGLDITYSPYPPETTYLRVENNLIAFNYVGVRIDSESRGKFRGNDFVENMEQILLEGYYTPNIHWEGNFWSDYKGAGDSPHVVQSIAEDLIDQNPNLRLFMYSPAYLTLELMKKTLPINPRIKAIDIYPSTKPHNNLPENISKLTPEWLIAAIILTVLPIISIILILRGGNHDRSKGGI